MIDDRYYFYVESGDLKTVLKIIHNFEWKIFIEKGDDLPNLEYQFNNQLEIDDIIDWLSQNYEYIQEISKDDIKDYIYE